MTPEEKKRLRRSYILATIGFGAFVVQLAFWFFSRFFGPDILSDYYLKPDSALRDVDSFRTAKVIKIPYSLQFDSEHLKALAINHNYIRFYFGLKARGDTVTLLAVGVNDNSEENDKIINEGTSNARTSIVEFADPCPICSTTNSKGVKFPQKRSLLYPFDTGKPPAEKVFTFYRKDACPK